MDEVPKRGRGRPPGLKPIERRREALRRALRAVRGHSDHMCSQIAVALTDASYDLKPSAADRLAVYMAPYEGKPRRYRLRRAGDEAAESESVFANEAAKVARRGRGTTNYGRAGAYKFTEADEAEICRDAELISGALETVWTKTAEHFLQQLRNGGWELHELDNLLRYASEYRGGLFVGAAAGDIERCHAAARAALEN